jgi:hypothetical protein
MKKNKILFWCLLLTMPIAAGLISGCQKFLDRKPLTATLDDLNQGAVESQSLGLYTTLRTYAGFSSLPWLDFHSIRDDDAQKGSNQTDGAEINAEFENFNYSKDDWAPNTYWNDHYYMINLANNELHDADSLKVTDEASLRNIGEASFFRAYSYFELVKTYGDVPKLTEKIVTASDGIKPKSPAADIYALIDADLAIAAKYLPINSSVYGAAFPGRLTSGAANTLWAQTYLFRSNWSQVVGLCNQVIASGQYSLNPSFVGIWKDGLNGAGKNGPESIWEMQCNSGPNAQSNSAVDNGTAWGTCQQIRQGGASLNWNLGWGWNQPTQVLVSAWDSTDPRKPSTILYAGQSDDPAHGGWGAILPKYDAGEAGGIARPYWNKKMYIGNDPAMRSYTGFINSNGQAPWINHRILRYADVLLMLAEASNELGDGVTAEAALEKVRERARGGSTTALPHIAFANIAQMRTAIKNERRFEFAMEGYRFYDLVRWGDAASALGGLGYTNRCRFYPIPQKAIDLSGGVLVQNPEW